MFLSRNWENVYSKKYCKIPLEVPENYYHWKVFLRETTVQRMICNHHNPHSSQRWQQLQQLQQQHSPLFPAIGWQIQKFSLKLPEKTNGKRFIVPCWVMDALGRCLGRIAKLTTTRGIVNWRHQRAQWEYVAHSHYWIWLGEFCSYVIIIIIQVVKYFNLGWLSIFFVS